MSGSNGNGVNGQGTGSVDEIGALPGPGLWLIVLDGGVHYLVRTAEEVTEAEVADAWAANGKVQFTARSIYFLDSVRGAVADADRKASAFSLPLSQRSDQRAGLCDSFPMLMTAHVVGFLSSMTPALRAQLRTKVDKCEADATRARAEQAGISMPAR